MDFEKLGVFYLGREIDPDSHELTDLPLLYDSSDLTTHAVIVGMTGSGKTGLGVSLIEEAAIDGVPVLAIDPKGDLGNLALTFPGLSAEEFEPWVDAREAEKRGLSLSDYAASEAQQWREGLASWGQGPERIERLRAAADVAVYTPGSNAGRPISVLRSFAAPPAAVLADHDLLSERLDATVTGLLTLLGLNTDSLGREHILLANILERAWRAGQDLDVGELIQAVQQPPMKRIGVMDLDTVFPANDRLKLALALNSLLAAPSFEAWTKGEALDVQRLLYDQSGKPRVAVVSIAHLSDAERMFFLTLLLSEVVAWTRSQSGTSSLRAILYIDELFGFLPPVSEPPTKKPLLTLLKQARAFGVGLVLATQNPIDIDYKALSNAGSWLVGRLQTERDKSRLIDGLSAAAPGAVPAAELSDHIGRLGKRMFLLHNVHDTRPVLFQTRWAMSYLAGPLTRDQIRQLSARPDATADASAAPPSAASATHPSPTHDNAGTAQVPGAGATATQALPATTTERPFLPPGVPQLFFPLKASASGVSYFPRLFGCADVHFSSKTHTVELSKRFLRLTDLHEGVVPFDWGESEASAVPLESTTSEPQAGVGYQPLPDVPLDAAAVKDWTNQFQRWLRNDGALTLLRFAPLKLVAEPHEDEEQFRLRCAQLLREERDAAKAKLRKRYDSRFSVLERRRLNQAQRVEKQTQQVQQRTLDAAVSLGGTILGAFLGRKAPTTSKISTAVSRAGRVGTGRGDIDRAQEALAQTEAEIANLQGELERELNELASEPVRGEELEFETVTIRAATRDMTMRFVGVAWVPYVRRADGRWIPA